MKNFRPLVLGTGWLVASTGCYSWAVAPEGTAVAAQQPTTLRLTLMNGRRIELSRARVVGDSLVGETYDGRASVAVAWVRTVEVSRFSTGKTVLAVGIPVVLGAALGGLVLSNWE